MLLLAIYASHLHAADDDFRARIVKIQGDVYIVNQQGEQRRPHKSNYLVNQMDTIVTGQRSKVVVQYDDGAMSVLDEESKLRVEKSGWLSQLSGKVYYLFRKAFGRQEPRKINTAFATIGIRGTTFIVYENEDGQGVALQEGKLNIESPGADYEIHKQQQADDFEAFKQQMQENSEALQREYQSYKKNINQEFVEYKKSFDLEANRMIRFDGNRVEENELSDDIVDSFDDFESFARNFIDAYRELDEIQN